MAQLATPSTVSRGTTLWYPRIVVFTSAGQLVYTSETRHSTETSAFRSASSMADTVNTAVEGLLRNTGYAL